MSTPNQSYETLSRTKIDLIGLDLVTVRGRAAVRSVVDSGDLTRVSDVYDSLSGLNWLFRRFFPLTRLFSASHGWFLPLRPESDPSYPPCAAFLQRKFAPVSADITGPVKRAVDLLTDPEKKPTDEELAATFMEAIYLRFAPGQDRLPDNIIEDAGKQAVEISDAFLPHRFIPARKGVHDVYDFVEKKLQDSGEGGSLPPPAVVDVAHALLATNLHGAKVLRAVANAVDDDLEHTLAMLGPTETVLRVPRRDSTLAGLLPEDQPAIRGKTLVSLDIRVAAAETGSFDWVFGKGDEHRRCTAEPAIKEFFQAVLDELKARRAIR